MAYRRVDLVERRGDFAVRGGLVDLFPATLDHPIRIDLFGDEIESIRPFALGDQRSLHQNISRVSVLPVRELLVTEEVKQRAEQVASRFSQLSEMASRIAAGGYPDGMESLAPLLVDQMIPLHQMLPEKSEVIMIESERIRTRSLELRKTDEVRLQQRCST